MRRVVIESPYAGDVERNLRYLRACMADSLKRGETPYASHGLLTQPGVLDDNDPEQRETGIKAGLVWHHVAHTIAFYTDLGWSNGMIGAREHAGRHRLPVEVRRIGMGWDR